MKIAQNREACDAQHQGAVVNGAWMVTTLGDTCDMYQPKTISNKEMIEDGAYLVYGANGVIGKYDKYNHEDSQLLITCRGATCGSVNVSEPYSWITGNAMVVRPKDASVNLKFLEYLFRGGIDIDRAITGAAQPQITRTNLASLEFSYPKSLAEQHRIVAILDEAFESIAIAKANTEKNLQNARVLFESHLESIFTERGEGWVGTTLDKISTNFDSKRIPITKSDRKIGEYPYYGASGVVDYVADYIFDGHMLLISEDGANLLARSTPIAFSVSGKYWVNNHAHVLKFEHMATQRFVEFYLASIRLDEYITGAAQPKLNQKALNSIPIPIPDTVGKQAEIVGRIEVFQEETQRLASLYQKKLTALDDLKKSLLHQAFSGAL
jgi:type I restriction enzyme S subunit